MFNNKIPTANCMLIKCSSTVTASGQMHKMCMKRCAEHYVRLYVRFSNTNQAFLWIVTLANKLELYIYIYAKFMQIHACNLSASLTSVPYCRGEGWRANWSWDNQLSFIIYTFLHLSFLRMLHQANTFGYFCVLKLTANNACWGYR